jgi:hypothetical protein
MDNNNKESGTNFAFWLPGSAIIFSLVVSTFALTRAPFLEPRPIGAQFQAETPIEARLWQDPFDALERYRKKVKDAGGGASDDVCTSEISSKTEVSTAPEPTDKTTAPPTPEIMVALVEGGAYADEVELRRRMRYAILAGFKNSHMVPEDEQHIRCLALSKDLFKLPKKRADDQGNKTEQASIPYETFIANPFDPPGTEKHKQPFARTILFWLKQDDLGTAPLQRLENLRNTLRDIICEEYAPPTACPDAPAEKLLKVIGPSTSAVLRDMYRDEADGFANSNIEIYSPLATADYELLTKDLSKPVKPMKLLRTVNDDRTMTRLLLDELKLRHVDPAAGAQCSPGAPLLNGFPCSSGGWINSNRVALISEWDSFYSRALIESFKSWVATDAHIKQESNAIVDDWVLRFSYLRGLDGRLPEEPASSDKATGSDNGKNSKDNKKLDLSPLESSDGNSQLDYLRRLADHIAIEDEAYRREGKSGIGAIGVLGDDAYDKLLVLQALKSRMPNKIFFSTNLDARMLQRGQAETTRNLVLAAPYGLTLTRALQQDVPPFRESLQSAVFVAVLAAQAPQPYNEKRVKFDYGSELLSPGIYEVGISGFIPLASQRTNGRPESCEPQDRVQAGREVRPRDIMSLRCLQDPSPPPYPEPSLAFHDQFKIGQSFFLAGPLATVLLTLAVFLGWWWTEEKLPETSAWERCLPLILYIVAGICLLISTQSWRVGFLWSAFVLVILAVIIAKLIRRTNRKLSQVKGLPVATPHGMFDSSTWYIVVPMIVFILALLWAYQNRSDLTDNGLGEPMFLFEGISAWPTVALRLLAALISISALGWGWRNLNVNQNNIESDFHLGLYMRKHPVSLWRHFPLIAPAPTLATAFAAAATHSDTEIAEAGVKAKVQADKDSRFKKWRKELGRFLVLVLFPLTSANIDWNTHRTLTPSPHVCPDDKRTIIFISSFWKEHCVCGAFGARLLRAVLASWIFFLITSVLFVIWPMENLPVRGESPIWMWSWLVPTLLFQVLVFWVVDANLLLTRFIRHLSNHYAIWPGKLRREHQKIFGVSQHPCIDDWVDILLIAKRTAAVSRLIYAPTVVLLILIASRSSLFDNWPTPPSIVISFLLTALMLFFSALSLRRAAERARKTALHRIDAYLLEEPKPKDPPAADAKQLNYDKLRLIRARIANLKTGAFSRYSEEPLVRALLLSLTGLGGSAIVDALNFAKF